MITVGQDRARGEKLAQWSAGVLKLRSIKGTDLVIISAIPCWDKGA